MRDLTVTIVGVGLIGGSLGLAWRKAGVGRVIGVTRRQETLDLALKCEAIDEGTTDMTGGVKAADVVVLCTPVSEIVPLAEKVVGQVRPGTLVTDVGSTKARIMESVSRFLPEDVWFIGGHPMAGSERTGVEAADPYLFENAVFCLTPPQGMPVSAAPMQRLQELVRAAGATPLVLTPEEHDLVVAGVSHVPHLVAAALVNTVADIEGLPMLRLAASGFRDTTRIAAGSSELWRDICLSNASAITQMLKAFEDHLAQLRQAVEQGNGEALYELLDKARETRLTMPASSAVHEFVVTLVDRPGAIHEVTGLIAEANLNIVDIGILKARHGEGGTLRVALPTSEAADLAVGLLRNNGYVAWRR